MFGNIIFRQLFDATSSTYTYVVSDPQSLEAVIIDTVFEQHFRDRPLRHAIHLGDEVPAPLEGPAARIGRALDPAKVAGGPLGGGPGQVK